MSQLIRRVKTALMSKMSAREKVLASIDLALMRLAEVQKGTYTAKDINDMYNNFLRQEGIDPKNFDIDWGNAIRGSVYNTLSQMPGSYEGTSYQEEVIADVTADLMVGENIDTGGEFGGGHWPGNVADFVRKYRDKKTDSDMETMFGKVVANKAQNKMRKRAPGDPAGEVKKKKSPMEFGGGDEDQGADQGGVIFEDLLDPGEREQEFTGEMKGTPADIVEMDSFQRALQGITENLRQKARGASPSDEDFRLYVLWKAYVDNMKKFLGEGINIREIVDQPVSFEDPNTGKQRTTNLGEFLEATGTSNVYYMLRKKLKPKIKKMDVFKNLNL